MVSLNQIEEKWKFFIGLTISNFLYIVVLLILAGISIASLTGSGLFAKAQQAKQESENAQAEENATLAEYEQWIESYIGSGIQGSAESSTASTHTPIEITYSWDEIANMANAISNNSSIDEDTLEVKIKYNNVTKTLGVGDYKTLDGKKVRILGFNHDNLTNKGAYGGTNTKAGISFEYVDFVIVSDTDEEITTTQMNNSATNIGGWGECDLRKKLNETVYNSLSIKDKIKQVQKVYIPSYRDPSASTECSDNLWLLSGDEIWTNWSTLREWKDANAASEGKPYKYYKLKNLSYYTEDNYLKKPGVENSATWWIRTIDWFTSDTFHRVQESGREGLCYAHVLNGVAPGFCLQK